MSMPLLRRARAGDEGPGRLRPQGHRPRPQPGRRSSTTTASSSWPRTRRNTLRKVSEIYDRIAFAGVGRYNEFDQLRVAGVRAADLKGYQYSRDDVDARSLANQYAQILGQIFTHEMKPMEVEILVAEVGPRRRAATRCSTSSTTAPSSTSTRFSVLGGDADTIAQRLEARLPRAAWRWPRRCRLAVGRAGRPRPHAGRRRPRGRACWSRSNGRRAFRRLDDAEVGRAARP